MENNYRLPKDLNESLKNMEDSIIPSLLDSSKRFTIEFNFEGLKFNRIGITIYKILAKNNNVFITFADQGAVLWLKETIQISKIKSLLLNHLMNHII